MAAPHIPDSFDALDQDSTSPQVVARVQELNMLNDEFYEEFPNSGLGRQYEASHNEPSDWLKLAQESSESIVQPGCHLSRQLRSTRGIRFDVFRQDELKQL